MVRVSADNPTTSGLRTSRLTGVSITWSSKPGFRNLDFNVACLTVSQLFQLPSIHSAMTAGDWLRTERWRPADKHAARRPAAVCGRGSRPACYRGTSTCSAASSARVAAALSGGMPASSNLLLSMRGLWPGLLLRFTADSWALNELLSRKVDWKFAQAGVLNPSLSCSRAQAAPRPPAPASAEQQPQQQQQPQQPQQNHAAQPEQPANGTRGGSIPVPTSPGHQQAPQTSAPPAAGPQGASHLYKCNLSAASLPRYNSVFVYCINVSNNLHLVYSQQMPQVSAVLSCLVGLSYAPLNVYCVPLHKP